jgi:signal transduction histidine kinase/ActR/RegA family two-component response regulator
VTPSDPPDEPSATIERFVGALPSADLGGLEGAPRGLKFRVEAHATLGRSPDATIMLDDPEVSRQHARLTRTTAGFELEDLRSRNGTFVNGTRITKRILAPGDKLRFGPHSVLEFQAVDVVDDGLVERQRLEAIGRFSTGTAHDLKNLLAALEASVTFLRDAPATLPLGDVEVRACVGDLRLAVTRASELTRDLLSLTQTRGADRGSFDLGELVGAAVSMLRRSLGRAIRLDVDLPRQLYVHGSRSELQQVLLNLVLNARDAMPHGGILRISLSRAVERDTGPAARERPVACLRISDTGIGMDADTQAHVFERFFTTKARGSGYGLGLSMVREIVQNHGGRIEVDSTKGSGTVFTVHVPLLDEEAVRTMSTAQRPSPSLPPSSISVKTVLIVDDEEVVRRSLSRLLTIAGLSPTPVADGRSAVSAYQSGRHDLVIVDVGLPGFDGFDTLRALLAIEPEARVLLTTGLASAESHALARTHGALGLLEKPFALQTLLRAIAEAAEFSPPTRPA